MTTDIEKLIKLLRDENIRVSRDAARVLTEMGKAAVETLIDALLDNSVWKIQKEAADILASIGDLRAVEPLCRALWSPTNAVRRSAAHALGALADARAARPLCMAMLDDDGTVRCSAAKSLGKIIDPKVIPVLIAGLADSYGGVRGACVNSLITYDQLAADQLIDEINRPGQNKIIRREATTALGFIKHPSGGTAVTSLCSLLKNSDANLRARAAEALGRIGDTFAVIPLCTAIRDSNPAVRIEAAIALGKIGDARAVVSLCSALNDLDTDIRKSSATSLGMIGDRDRLPIRILLNRTMSAQERVHAFNVLASTRAYYIEDGKTQLYNILDARKFCRNLAASSDPAVRSLATDMQRIMEGAQLLRPNDFVNAENWESLPLPAFGDNHQSIGTELVRSSDTVEEQQKKPFWKRWMQSKS